MACRGFRYIKRHWAERFVFTIHEHMTPPTHPYMFPFHSFPGQYPKTFHPLFCHSPVAPPPTLFALGSSLSWNPALHKPPAPSSIKIFFAEERGEEEGGKRENERSEQKKTDERTRGMMVEPVSEEGGWLMGLGGARRGGGACTRDRRTCQRLVVEAIHEREPNQGIRSRIPDLRYGEYLD